MKAGPETPKGAVRHREVDEEHAGQRLDNFLLASLKGVPRTHVYRLIRSGQVRVNGGRVKADRRLVEGDEVARITPPPGGHGLLVLVGVTQQFVNYFQYLDWQWARSVNGRQPLFGREDSLSGGDDSPFAVRPLITSRIACCCSPRSVRARTGASIVMQPSCTAPRSRCCPSHWSCT